MPMKALLIDDDPICLKVLSRMVRKHGLEVHECESAEAGFSLLKAHHDFAIILSDWVLPRVSGLDLCRLVRKMPEYRLVYFILVTAQTNTSDFAVALEAGADAFIRKPLTAPDLDAQLRAAHRTVGLQQELFQEQQHLRESERELRRIVERQQRLLASIPSLYLSLDDENRVKAWNVAAEKTFGIEATAAIGRYFFDLPLEWDWLAVREHLTRSREEETCVRISEFEYRRGDAAHTRYIDLAFVALDADELGEESVLLIGEDVTVRKTLLEQVAQSQKLEALGQLASGVAHEINTPLQFINDNLRFLNKALTKLEPEYQKLLAAGHTPGSPDISFYIEELKPTMEQTIEGIQRVNHVVRAMKDFSHPGARERMLCDINGIIRDACTISRAEVKSVAAIKLELSDELLPVSVFSRELAQAIINILINAAHAIADGKDAGKIDPGLILLQSRQRGQEMLIEISDNGIGMSEEIRRRACEPAFTTKAMGRGTGQGLSMASDVIQNLHGGRLEIESKELVGTTMRIILPATAPSSMELS